MQDPPLPVGPYLHRGSGRGEAGLGNCGRLGRGWLVRSGVPASTVICTAPELHEAHVGGVGGRPRPGRWTVVVSRGSQLHHACSEPNSVTPPPPPATPSPYQVVVNAPYTAEDCIKLHDTDSPLLHRVQLIVRGGCCRSIRPMRAWVWSKFEAPSAGHAGGCLGRWVSARFPTSCPGPVLPLSQMLQLNAETAEN